MSQQEPEVMRLSACRRRDVTALLQRYGLQLQIGPADAGIPGSYWGAEEAGLIGCQVMVRDDTPVHSILHEACHYVCMAPQRRDGLDTNAGGDYDEENAVCYLQILLADELPGMDRQRMCADMDAWGYTFRLGSARRWFEQDADDARQWLLQHHLISNNEQPSWKLRTTGD